MSNNDRRAKMEEIIALNTERHNRLQEEEDFEAYYRENIRQITDDIASQKDYDREDILQILDDIVRQVAAERSAEVATETAPGRKSPLSTGMGDFFARFEGAYQSLMEAMFPSVALSGAAMAMRSGTRSATESLGATDAMAPKDSNEPITLTPAQEEARSRLPAWVVVPYAYASPPGTEFAILWAGEGEAPGLPAVELRLNGEPQDESILWLEPKKDVKGLPPGDLTFVQFDTDASLALAFTIGEREDGGLVIDFMR